MTAIDLTKLHDQLKDWAETAVSTFDAASVSIFGSLIYKNGDQFNDSSDLDLVVLMPDMDDAVSRHRWLEAFANHKDILERDLLRPLKRLADEPTVSVVAITTQELAYDVHKDGHREFFSANTFRNLVTGEETKGHPSAATKNADRFLAAALGFTQKIRNRHFSVSANGTTHLKAYHGSDPLPKQMMRAAAMAGRAAGTTTEPGAEHDLKEGLDVVSSHLYRVRGSHRAYSRIQDLLSVRRGARGAGGAFEPSDQLLLAEVIYDIALKLDASSSDGAPTDDGIPTIESKTIAEPSGLNASKPSDTTLSTKAIAERPKDGRTDLPLGSTAAFFAERFGSAFPGIRSTTWFDDPAEIGTRMLKLLEPPLIFSDSRPIWWFRGGNLHIENFVQIHDRIFLMDHDELAIRRIAAVPNQAYKRQFVYVEVSAMEPTGLYPERLAKSKEYIKESGYDYEEYGIFAGRHLLTRGEYDDGHKMINGDLVSTAGNSELRIRYVSPYNFIIAANGSPINNPEFDEYLEKSLNKALLGDAEDIVEQISSAVNKLPLRQHPYG